jgi:hypothetical protein
MSGLEVSAEVRGKKIALTKCALKIPYLLSLDSAGYLPGYRATHWEGENPRMGVAE